jgi:hypothetical protein
MRKPRLSATQRHLRRLIEEATVDCYGEWEQASGFLTMIQDHIACPVTARVVGEPVQVIGFDCGEGGTDVVAKCKRHGKTYKIGVLSLEWDQKPPKGAEWIEAYRAWLRGA